MPNLLAMIESFWKEIENQYLSSLRSALYSEGQFVSVICVSVVGAYKVTVLVTRSEMTEYKICAYCHFIHINVKEAYE